MSAGCQMQISMHFIWSIWSSILRQVVVGIRFFLDLWILNHSVKDKQEKKKRGKTGTLWTDRIWICSQIGDRSLVRKGRAYRINASGGTVYSGWRRCIWKCWKLGNCAEVRNQGKLKSVIRRIWLPYEELCWSYPSLEGKRYIQPYYEAKRFFKMIADGRWNRSVQELKANAKGQELSDVEGMMKKLGLR